MKGLELSRAYYEEYGKPMIDTQLAQYKPYRRSVLSAKVRNVWDSMMSFLRITISDRHSACGCRRNSTRRQVPRSTHTIACRLLTKAIRGSHLHRAEAGSEFFRWRDFIVNSPDFLTLRRIREWFPVSRNFLATGVAGFLAGTFSQSER